MVPSERLRHSSSLSKMFNLTASRKDLAKTQRLFFALFVRTLRASIIFHVFIRSWLLNTSIVLDVPWRFVAWLKGRVYPTKGPPSGRAFITPPNPSKFSSSPPKLTLTPSYGIATSFLKCALLVLWSVTDSCLELVNWDYL